MQRGSGQTSEQMKSAPRDAVFVWCNESLRYPKQLARHLGREDLKIARPVYDEVFMIAAGTKRDVVIDHEADRTANKSEHDMISEFAAIHNFHKNF